MASNARGPGPRSVSRRGSHLGRCLRQCVAANDRRRGGRQRPGRRAPRRAGEARLFDRDRVPVGGASSAGRQKDGAGDVTRFDDVAGNNAWDLADPYYLDWNGGRGGIDPSRCERLGVTSLVHGRDGKWLGAGSSADRRRRTRQRRRGHRADHGTLETAYRGTRVQTRACAVFGVDNVNTDPDRLRFGFCPAACW